MFALLAALALSVPLFDAPLESLVRGQRGVCHTVFEGDRIEPFEFEIKGVMHNYLGPQRDLVLVRLLGDKPNFTGVVSGMSGSPCSIDGKLLGALGYAFATFAKEPIAGITPIGSMLDVMRLPSQVPPWRLAGGVGAGTDADWQAIRSGTALASGEAAVAGPRPISTPLVLGGVPPLVRRHYDPWLRSLGFEPVAAGPAASARRAGTPPQRLTPGGAVAAVLVQGDIDIAATGTVTYVEGDQVLAFGHPFLGTGSVSYPMAAATILNTMVSAHRSFKMSTTGQPLGEITEDRLTAIGGRMGQVPQTLPVSGRIRAAGHDSRFHFEVSRDETMSPRLLAMGMASALGNRVESGQRGTVRVDGRVQVAGLGDIPWRSVYAETQDAALMVGPGIDLARFVSVLWTAQLGPPPAMQLTLDLVHEPEPMVERIEALAVDRPRVRVGETLTFSAALRRLDGSRHQARFEVVVPHAWSGQELSWRACNNDAAEHMLGELYGPPQPQDRRALVQHLRQRRGDGQLYLLGSHAGASLQVGARPLAFLPGSVVATLAAVPGQRRQRAAGLAWEASQPRPGTVDGQAQVSVNVVP